MSEHAGLPRHPYPVLLPDVGGFEEAMGRARVRRRRQVFEATAMLSMVALLAGGVVLSRPDGNQAQLEITNTDVDPRPHERGGDDLQAVPGPVVPGASQAASTEDAGPGTSGDGPSPRPAPAPQATVGQPPADLPEKQPGAMKYLPVRRTETLAADCRAAGETGPWCLMADVNQEDAFRYTLTAVVCRLVDTSQQPEDVLTFPTEQEVDYEILLKDQVRWTWSKGQGFEPGERNLTVRQGECVAWDVRWDAEDEDGYLLHPSNTVGQYTLRIRSSSTQLAGRHKTKNFTLQ